MPTTFQQHSEQDLSTKHLELPTKLFQETTLCQKTSPYKLKPYSDIMDMQTPMTFAGFGAVPNTGSGIISVPEEPRCDNCGFGIHSPDVGCANCGYVPRRRYKNQENQAETPASISMPIPFMAPPAAMPKTLQAPHLVPAWGHCAHPYVYGTIFSHETTFLPVEIVEGFSDFSAGEIHGHSIGSTATN